MYHHRCCCCCSSVDVSASPSLFSFFIALPPPSLPPPLAPLYYLYRMVPLSPPPIQILGISGTPYLLAPSPFSSAVTTIATVSAATIATTTTPARQKASDAQQYSNELQQGLQAGYIAATCISICDSNSTDGVFGEAELQAAVERFGSSDDVWSAADFMSCGFFPTSQSLLTENV